MVTNEHSFYSRERGSATLLSHSKVWIVGIESHSWFGCILRPCWGFRCPVLCMYKTDGSHTQSYQMFVRFTVSYVNSELQQDTAQAVPSGEAGDRLRTPDNAKLIFKCILQEDRETAGFRRRCGFSPRAPGSLQSAGWWLPTRVSGLHFVQLSRVNQSNCA